jgi:hypothetical protein
LVKETQDVTKFEGYTIRRRKISIVDPQNYESVPLNRRSERLFAAPSKIFGQPVNPTCLNGVKSELKETPEVKIYTVPKSRIIGHTVLLGDDGQLFCPSPCFSDEALQKFKKVNLSNHHGCVFEENHEQLFAYYVTDGVDRTVDKSAIFLHNLEPGNFGSFLFRQLTQLLLLKDFNFEFDTYIVPDRTSWLREAIAMAGLPVRPIFTVREVSGLQFRSISIMNEFDAEGLFSENVSNRLLTFSRTYAANGYGNGQKIYISRSLGRISRPHSRHLINELEVEKIMEDRGFTIVYPEVHSLEEQVSIFQKARLIAGPSGSGMLNAVFSEPGSRVLDMESFHYTVRQHAKIYSSTGKDYSFIFGEPEQSSNRPLHGRPWYLSLKLLEEGLDWLLG